MSEEKKMTVAERAKEAMSKSKKPGTMAGLKSTDVSSLIDLYKNAIAQAAPKHMTADRIIQQATTLISRNPEIAECTIPSLIGAVMQASLLGFQPVTSLGQCYFVPFWNNKVGNKEIQFQIGYKGLIDLARRSGNISVIYAQAVYANDEFEYEFGLEPKLIHKPAFGERGDLIYTYAVARFKDGGFAFDVLDRKEIEKARSQSAAKKSGPWFEWYDEMAKKTAVKRLAKYLPLSVDVSAGIATDGAKIEIDNFDRSGEGVILDELDYVDFDEMPEPETQPEHKGNDPFIGGDKKTVKSKQSEIAA